MTFKSAVLLFALLCCTSLHAGSPVWKVSKGGKHFYLGGTIHMLKASDYPLPKAYETAYKDAQEVVLETDIAQMNTPEAQAKVMAIGMLPMEKTLKTELKPSTYKALSAYMEKIQVPIWTFAKFKPGMVAMTLTVMEIQKLGYQPEKGVDMHFLGRAKKDQKASRFLESIDVQLSLLSMEGIDSDQIIEYTLRDLGRMREMMDTLKKAWRNGDLKELEKTGMAELRIYPELFKKLLTDRNNNWLIEFNKFIRTAEVEMVLVGALHLAGPEGLLQQLKARGFKVENL